MATRRTTADLPEPFRVPGRLRRLKKVVHTGGTQDPTLSELYRVAMAMEHDSLKKRFPNIEEVSISGF